MLSLPQAFSQGRFRITCSIDEALGIRLDYRQPVHEVTGFDDAIAHHVERAISRQGHVCDLSALAYRLVAILGQLQLRRRVPIWLPRAGPGATRSALPTGAAQRFSAANAGGATTSGESGAAAGCRIRPRPIRAGVGTRSTGRPAAEPVARARLFTSEEKQDDKVAVHEFPLQ